MRRPSIVLLTVLLAGTMLPVTATTSPAGFFDQLFRPRGFQQPLFPPGDIGPPIRRGPPAEPQIPKVEVLPKDPDARKVLVIGDFLATGLAAGLDQDFAEVPKIAIVDQTKGPSGFVRLDRFDWTKALPDILNSVGPDFVVVMIGTNDRQQIGWKDQKAAIRSDAWLSAYNERLANFAATLKVYGRPIFWVGLPPMRSTAASADMAAFNALYKVQVEAVGGKFIDVWDGFANEEGKFVSRAPDVAGQVRLLRSGDGINFTRAGQNKLAFFVEREIRRAGGVGGGPALASSATAGERIEVSPDGRRWRVGPVISLSDPPPGAPGNLMGGEAPATPKKDSTQYRFVVEGASLPHVRGRADDYQWALPGEASMSPEIDGGATTATTASLPGATAPILLPGFKPRN